MEQTNQNAPQTVIVINNKKSVGLALILTFFFGPLGLLYATVAGGVIMLILGVLIGVVTLGFGLIFVWIASMIWAVIAVNSTNNKATV